MRVIRGVVLALFCTCGLIASGLEAQSAQRKFEAIEQGRLRPGTSLTLTSAELNSWVGVQAKLYVPQGLRNPHLAFESGRVTGSALMDFVRMRQAETGELPGWLTQNLFGGERPVSVAVRVESRGGQARVDVESVEVSGVQISGEVLDFLIQRFLLPTFPDAKTGEWFSLDWGIDHFTITPAGVSVYEGGIRRVALQPR